ncbi:hypothetical protein UlMin_021017 [Ulmus minor]
MEAEEGTRLRKQALSLKPIETKRKNDRDRKENGDYFQVGEININSVEEEEEPVSPAGRFFHEPKFNVHIISIFGCKTRIFPDVIKANLPCSLLKHPRFSSLLVVDEKNGEMKWVRTEVDLEKHVIVPDIDSKNNMKNLSPDEVIENYIYNLTKTSLDKSKPLWDLHLLNIKTTEAESVGIFRVHHSLGDGTSLMSLLLACTRQTSNPQALPTLPTVKKVTQISNKGSFIRKFSKQFFGFWSILRLFWNTFIDVLFFLATMVFLRDTQTPVRAPPGCFEYTPRRIVFRIVSLDDIKLVKNAMNSTINDVVLGITQAGLSRYLNRRYGENKNNERGSTEIKNNLPKKIRLRSNLIVNIRPSPGIQALADMMEKDTEAKWGNWMGYVLLPFTIGLRDDPLDYIRHAKATVDRKKHSLEALCTFSISGLLYKLFGLKLTSAIFHRVLSSLTMAFSNLVGPLEEISFYGHPMAYLAATSYGQPHELMVSLQSYANKMTIVLAVDENTIPDPHLLCDDIAESLNLVKNVVIEKGLI